MTISDFPTPTSSPGHCKLLPSITDPDGLITCHCWTEPFLAVTSFLSPPQIQGGKTDNYMSKMFILPLSSRARTQTFPLEFLRPILEDPSCSGRGSSTMPLSPPRGDWVFPLIPVFFPSRAHPTSKTTPTSSPSLVQKHISFLTPELMWKCLSLILRTRGVIL